MTLYLVEVSPRDDAGVPQTIRLATEDYTTKPSDIPSNAYYESRLKEAGLFEQHLFSAGDGISGGTTSGEATAGSGSVVALNGTAYGDIETLDYWLNLNWVGAPIVIKRVADNVAPLTQAVIEFSGNCSHLVSDNALEEFEIVIRDRLSELEDPLLDVRYAGTTVSTGLGIEGDENLKDRVKPAIWGRVSNILTVSVNVFDLIYQVSSVPVSSITVYDGGYGLLNEGDTSNESDLMAASIVAGGYKTCLALGLFRLGASPFSAITADVTEGSTLAQRSAAQLVKRILLYHGITAANIIDASFSALDALNAAECGVSVTGEDSCLSVVQRVLNSIGGYILPDAAGRFFVGRFQAPSGTPVATFQLEDNLGGAPERIATGDEGKGVPIYRVTIRYDRVWQVQQGTEIVGVVDDTRRAYLGREWRESVAEDLSILTANPLAPTLTVDTCLANIADAFAESGRVLALRKVKRDFYRMTLPLEYTVGCVPGSIVTLQSPRLGLAAGKLFVIVGRVERRGTGDTIPIVDLECWG